MANVKISELPVATSAEEDSSLPVVVAQLTKRITPENFLGFVQAKTYGAVGDGVTDDTAALIAAITAAAGKVLLLPGGTYNFNPSAGITTVACKITGAGKENTIISITGNGDVFQRAAWSVFEDLTVDMNGDVYSGHCMRFANPSPGCEDRGIEIWMVASGKHALLFDADGGSQFFSSGSHYVTLTTAGSGAAVKMGNDTGSRPRVFVGSEGSGCTVFDFGGANNVAVFGGVTNGLLWSGISARTNLFGMRIGSVAGRVSITGDGHQIVGCVFSDPVDITSSTNNVVFHSAAGSNDITDAGNANQIDIPWSAYTPVWTAAAVNPALGDGTLVGTFERHGKTINATIKLTIGTTTTFGTGAYRISLPWRAGTSSGVVWTGSIWATDLGTVYKVGTCYVASAGTYLEFIFEGTTVPASATVPFTWATGDQLVTTITYQCGIT
jgi:hypothetical protein